MDKLLFLTNELMNPKVHHEMHLPLQFIAFGIAEGKMFHHYGKYSTFIVPHSTKPWGNDVVYGGLFLCKDYDFYARILDAYHLCSMSTLYRNHVLDTHHRIPVEITPIYFETLEELANIKYREGESITAQTYLGNLHHPKIIQRIISKKNSHRIIDGIDVEHFKQLFGEVNHE